MRALERFASQDLATAMGLTILCLFLGLFISARLGTRWGYVLSLLAVLFGLYALRLNGLLRF